MLDDEVLLWGTKELSGPYGWEGLDSMLCLSSVMQAKLGLQYWSLHVEDLPTP
jgi:hypothetical protein